MHLSALPAKEQYSVRPSTLESFGSKPVFYQIHGPARLVRLVQFAKINRSGESLVASRRDGEFWFEEEMFNQLRRHAEADLQRQAARDKKPFTASVQSLAGVYVRHVLRDQLAVRKDWTDDFDAYVTLALGRSDSVIALVGQIKGQPYYSPGHKQAAATADLKLLGRKRQYAIDFRQAVNAPLVDRIHGPTLF